jgi:hypothetical protein
MAVTAKTPRGGTPPWRIEPDQPKDDGQSANNAQSGKKRKGASGDTCSANNNGKTTTKSRKWSSAEGHIDEDEAAGAKGAPGGHERLTAPNGRKASSTQGAGTKYNVDGAMPSPDGNAEHNDQGAKDADPNEQGANEKSQETSRSNEHSTNESSLSHDSSMQMPLQNTTVSKIVFFQFGKTRKSNLTIICHPSLS